MNILIIGATSGIGHGLWKHYAESGHHIAVMGRRKNLLDAMAAEFPQLTFAVQCDVADIGSFNIALGQVIDRLKYLDLAIICAGTGELNPELDKMVELDTLSLNVMGWTNAVDAIYDIFMCQKYGHLVTITSVGGMQPAPIAPAYSASKAFQINYTKSLQLKSKHSGITVTEIRPGLVDTRMAKGEGLFWVMPVDKVVRQITAAISHKRKLRIVTRRWRILNWIIKHFM